MKQNRIAVDDRMIKITCDRADKQTQDICETIAHIHSNRIKTEYKTSSSNMREVLLKLRGIDDSNMDEAPVAIRERVAKLDEAKQTITNLKRMPLLNSGTFLMPHQELGRQIAAVKDRYGFFYSTRTGKTIMSLQIIADDLAKNPANKWLILCPLILIEHAWLEDAKKFFPQLNIVNLHAKSKAERLKKFAIDANIYIQNIESFCSYREHIDKLGITGCVLDESSAMKSPRAQFSKQAVDFSTTVKKWYLLSGTPAPNSETEYYMQLRSIDFYAVPASYTKFVQHYFDNISYNPQFPKYQLKKHLSDEFNSLVESMSIYVDAEDVLEMPGRSFEARTVPMPANVNTHYKSMKNNLAVELVDEGKEITAPSAAAKANKLRQLAAGFIYDEEGTATLLSTYKFDALQDLLNEPELVGNQVLIWANYRYEFDIIKQYLGDRCAILNGSCSLAEKTKALNDFKQRQVQYLVANPASLDKGVTLTNAHLCIYFSLDYSYERYEQSIARIYGGKHSQKEFCKYYFLLVEHSIDPIIYNAVLKKKDVSMAILDYIRKR